MRIELEDEKKEFSQEDNALNPETKYKSDLTRKERRLQEKEKLAGMGLGAKLQYIWMYYKPVMAAVVAAVVLFLVGKDMYENSKIQNLLTITVVNAGDVDTKGIGENIKEFLGSEDKYEEVSITTNLRTEASGEALDYYTQMAFIAQVQAQSLDVMVLPESLFKSLAKEEFFAELKGVLGEETYAAFGEQIEPYYLKLTGSQFAKDMGLFYEPVCVGVIVNSKNMENAGKWMASLAE